MRRTLARVLLVAAATACADDGVFLRVQLAEPATAHWYARIGGFVHRDPWYLANTVWPAGADKRAEARLAPASFSPWFDLRAHAAGKLHGRLDRAGGVAEFPNVTIQFMCDATNPATHAVIELATAPDEGSIVKRFEESFTGRLTSVLVSPDLRRDADALETASQMTARRLAWAREASGGRRVAPSHLWVQTQFWAAQRPELNLREAEVLELLGFNVVGNQTPEMAGRFSFRAPGGHHTVNFAPGMTASDIAQHIAGPAAKARDADRPVPYNFSDEIACRPPIGSNVQALAHFRAWLKERRIKPAELAVASLDDVAPIETPPDLRERQQADRAAANRVFYWTTRFRQESATERLRWLTEGFHRHAPTNVLTSTLVADHPYFGGTGLGMGMQRENSTWGGWPLALDWFGLARARAVDVMGIEDWLGLQFMYGPHFTWEGFQLIGFQAAIFRSGSRGEQPVIAWITPSDERNLRLKSASALCQGAKHFYYWTYGPTATSTENYWSDLRGAYDGIVAMTRHLAGAEHIIAPGRTRAARVAVLYSLSSDLWQPFGYVSMAERRLTYFSLIHDQHLVDFLTEQDVVEGRLKDYRALYVADPCVSAASCAAIRKWVQRGGALYGSAGAASRNEFDEPHAGLADVFGLAPTIEVRGQPGRFDLRGALNGMPWLDQVRLESGAPGFGALGLRAAIQPAEGQVAGRFSDDTPAVVANRYGRGLAVYVATCPGVSYAKDARFVAADLKEQWPAAQRAFINATAQKVPRLVALSHPVVEAGVFDAEPGTALVLANFTYTPISNLVVRLPRKQPPAAVRSMSAGRLDFTLEQVPPDLRAEGYRCVVRCCVPLGWSDILTFERVSKENPE